ncbi:MAG: MarR family winged helix-turn-helix transcriptional regulator [Microbacteriaceae bacterium]
MNTNVKLANASWEALFTAHTALMRGFKEADSWSEVSMSEYDVLYTLSKQREAIRLADLREGVLLSQPALSRLVDRLVCRGLISRVTDDSDRRAVRLALTDEGREVQRIAGMAHAADVARGMRALGDDEMRQLQRICEKLAQSTRPE